MAFLESVLDFFYPRRCFYCQQSLKNVASGYICPKCFQQFVFNNTACCTCCGRALGAVQPTICPNCLELKPSFRQGVSLFAYNPIGRQFIHTLKYHNGVYLVKDLLKMLKKEQDRVMTLNDAYFVPVPLHFLRKWKRGFNQSFFIAKALRQICQGEILDILKRKKNTPSQTSLTRKERKLNVLGAFTSNVKVLDPNKKYVLVDDVFTTGVTLNECAKVLCEKGALDVRVFTLAHG